MLEFYLVSIFRLHGYEVRCFGAGENEIVSVLFCVVYLVQSIEILYSMANWQCYRFLDQSSELWGCRDPSPLQLIPARRRHRPLTLQFF